MNKIEDQALTVYHFWYCKMHHPRYSDAFNKHLLGLFELLKEHLPEQADEALGDAVARLVRDGAVQQ